jgi:hypothetical protein
MSTLIARIVSRLEENMEVSRLQQVLSIDPDLLKKALVFMKDEGKITIDLYGRIRLK